MCLIQKSKSWRTGGLLIFFIYLTGLGYSIFLREYEKLVVFMTLHGSLFFTKKLGSVTLYMLLLIQRTLSQNISLRS
jgi:hypothetical protein